MKAKNKAKELLDRYAPLAKYWDCYNDEPLEENNAKICALIAVQEIINSNPHSNPLNTNVYSTMDYWLEVKHEIEKL